MKSFKVIIGNDGIARFIYDDAVMGVMNEISEKVCVKRASHVEPDENGLWFADMAPVGGEKFIGFKTRQEALDFEVDWLNQHNIPVAH